MLPTVSDKIKFGVSTASFYPVYTEEAFSYLCSGGVKNVEYFINTHSEMCAPIAKRIKKLSEEYGVNIQSIHPYTGAFEPFMIFTEYDRRFEDTLEYFKRFLEAAAYLNAKFFVFHGDKKNGRFTNEMYFERYLKMFEAAEGFGVTLLQENVERCKSGTIEFLSDMKRQLGDKAMFTFDIKQAVRRGQSPLKMLRVLGNSVKHIHISDNDRDKSCMLVGEGTFDFKEMFRILSDFNYNGALILEYYDFCYSDKSQVIDSLEVLKSIYLSTITE